MYLASLLRGAIGPDHLQLKMSEEDRALYVEALARRRAMEQADG